MDVKVIEPVIDSLQLDTWLWCMECERFFQYGHMEETRRGLRDRCPFFDCTGAGIDVSLLAWDAFREPDDPRWPRSTKELSFGLRSPDMQPFYEACAKQRRDGVLDRFRRSAYWPGRDGWVDCMLLCAQNITAEPHHIDLDTLVYLLFDALRFVRCPPKEAGEVVHQLRAFFAFAAAEPDYPHAATCHAYLSEASLAHDVERALRADRNRARRKRKHRKRRGRVHR